MFLALNQQRKPVNVIERFNAALLAKDESALEIESIVSATGFKLVTNGDGHSRKAGKILAVGALVFIHRNYQTGTLFTVLQLLQGAYGAKIGPSAEVMRAIATFLHMYRGQFDEARLELVLSRLPMTRWEQEANEVKRALGCHPEVATRHVLVKHYNHGLRNKLPNLAEIG